MTPSQGADELRIRSILRKRGVGPDAEPPDPADDEPEDWWDKLYDDEPTKPDAEGDEGGEEPEPTTAPTRPATASTRPTYRNSRPSPRQSLLEAWDSTTPRLRWLIYHGTAAGFGWGLGLVTWSTHVTSWIAADRYSDPQSITCYGLALAAVAAYRRTRHWWWPLAWAAAVPVSSIALGVLLYAPNS